MEFVYSPVVNSFIKETPKIDISNLSLVSYKDDILKKEMPNFDFRNPPFDPIEFANILVKKMVDLKGLGLSANQLGVETKCFAMVGDPNYVCYNPILVGYGEEEWLYDEGCLSYPDLYIKIKRPKTIKVRFTMPNGEVTTKTFAGLTARVFLHEMDHMNGLNPLSKTQKFKISDAIKKANKKNHNYILKDFI